MQTNRTKCFLTLYNYSEKLNLGLLMLLYNPVETISNDFSLCRIYS